jgi:hypothetical protein
MSYRAPEVSRALAAALKALNAADTDYGKLLAIRDGMEALDRIGDDGSGAIDALSEAGIARGLDPDDVQNALAEGIHLSHEDRARQNNTHKSNGNGIHQTSDIPLREKLGRSERSERLNGKERSWRDAAVTAATLRTKTFEPIKFILPGLITEGVNLLVSRPKLGGVIPK